MTSNHIIIFVMSHRGALTGSELDVASDYISAECFPPLRLAITIITLLARQGGSAAAHQVRMSQGFSGSEGGRAASGSGVQGRVCF